MASSGTFTWNLDVVEVIEEAYETAGLELLTAFDLISARRSLNLLLTEWMNDGVNLWTMDQLTVALTTSTQSYTLDAKYTDLLDAVTRDADSIDVENRRLSLSEYLHRPNKATTGQPIQHALERNASGGHTLYIWPTAADNTYTFVAWAIRYMHDVDDYTDNFDIPRRFLPPLVLGLAHKIALKRSEEVTPQLRAELKNEYIGTYQAAMFEDRERASLYLLPDNRRHR